jgi:predicted transcriptional regulator YdeE
MNLVTTNETIKILVTKYQQSAAGSQSWGLLKKRSTVFTIWNNWLPHSQYHQAETPYFERYDERFDSLMKKGVLEIWVPIE